MRRRMECFMKRRIVMFKIGDKVSHKGKDAKVIDYIEEYNSYKIYVIDSSGGFTITVF
jgi:hypothetical protein